MQHDIKSVTDAIAKLRQELTHAQTAVTEARGAVQKDTADIEKLKEQLKQREAELLQKRKEIEMFIQETSGVRLSESRAEHSLDKDKEALRMAEREYAKDTSGLQELERELAQVNAEARRNQGHGGAYGSSQGPVHHSL